MELWSYNKTRWEPVLEPFGVLVHFHHNSRSRVVSTLRPGSHLKIKATSDEGLHLTVAHAALDSLLRSTQDAAAVMTGGATDVLANGRKSARYAYVHNRLGVPCQCLLDYGTASVAASLEDGGKLRMMLPRAIQYQRKRPEPPSAPKVRPNPINRWHDGMYPFDGQLTSITHTMLSHRRCQATKQGFADNSAS